MKKPNELGGNGRRCVTRRGLLYACAGAAGLVICAGLGAVPRKAKAAPADGWTDTEVNLSIDNEASLFCGGNMTVTNCVESEGVTVCVGDLTYDLWDGTRVARQLCAKVAWGMGIPPTPYVDHLVVGGSFYHKCVPDVGVTGNIRIGGSVVGDPGAGKLLNINEAQVQAWTDEGINDVYNMNAAAWLYYYELPDDVEHEDRYGADNIIMDRQTRREYQDAQNRCVISQHLGRDTALVATATDDGGKVDYGAFVEERLRPMSEVLSNLPVTGVASYSKVGSIVGHRYWNEYTVDSDVDAWLTLTGDGESLLQVFEVDAAELDRQLAALGCVQWSLDLVDVPEDASVVVNVRGEVGDWHPGWLNRWDGKECDTWINDVPSSEGFKAYVRIASAMLWNFADTSKLTVCGASGTTSINSWAENNTGVLMPGTILVPNGDVTLVGDTNGHVLCSGDMRLEIWEHHNVPWRGSFVVPTIDIPVEKVWEGAGYDKFAPGSVTVRLFGNGEEVASLTLSDANGWKSTFEDLPEVDYYWQPISYVVREDEVAHFSATVTGSETVGFTVKNALVAPLYANISVRKVWTGEGAAEALPDELVVHIVGTDGSDRPVTLNKANHWQATIDELPQLDADGDWVTYSLDERDVPDGFRLVSVEGDVTDGWVVTNEYQKGEGGLTKEASEKSWL